MTTYAVSQMAFTNIFLRVQRLKILLEFMVYGWRYLRGKQDNKL